MLGSIKGIIAQKQEKYLLVETHGLGYKIYTSGSTLAQKEVGEEVYLFLYTHVREDIFDLYGFTTTAELDFFELLISVSGIGPKGALGILSIADADTLKHAIKSNDLAYLTKVSGIGKKTAEKIVLELRDRIELDTTRESSQNDLDILEALRTFGYRENDIRDVLRQINSDQDTSTKIKQALKILGGK